MSFLLKYSLFTSTVKGVEVTWPIDSGGDCNIAFAVSGRNASQLLVCVCVDISTQERKANLSAM